MKISYNHLLQIGFLLTLSIFVPWLYGEASIQFEKILQPPSLFHPFGTDDLGKDLFYRSCLGLRISFFVGLIAAFFDLAFGLHYGAIAGLYKKPSIWMMRIADILYTVPLILMVLLFMSILGPGLLPIIFAFFFSSWINMARVYQKQVQSLAQKPFVIASKMMGGSYLHIFQKHFLPNSSSLIFALLNQSIAKAIFTEAFLSFLGLGISPPISSLGALIAEGAASMEFFPWRFFFPSMMLSWLLFSFHQLSSTEKTRSLL